MLSSKNSDPLGRMDSTPHLEMSCQNESCPEYGKLQTKTQRNIQKFGFTAKGHQRYVCRICKRTFSQRNADDQEPVLFGRRLTPHDTIYNLLVKVGVEHISIVQVAQETGFKEDSILAWAREVAAHRIYPQIVTQVNEHLRTKNGLGNLELQAFWAYVDEKDRNRRNMRQ